MSVESQHGGGKNANVIFYIQSLVKGNRSWEYAEYAQMYLYVSEYVLVKMNHKELQNSKTKTEGLLCKINYTPFKTQTVWFKCKLWANSHLVIFVAS